MKIIIKVIPAILTLSLAISCNNIQQNIEVNSAEEVEAEKVALPDEDSQFKDAMTGKVYHYYLQMSRALFDDNVNTVNESAKNIVQSLGDKVPNLKAVAVKISTTRDLKKQRKLFSEFGNAAGELFSENLAEGTIYQQFCPMAFNGAGAYWYSEEKEIVNPYFGEEMPICGTTKQTIEPKI